MSFVWAHYKSLFCKCQACVDFWQQVVVCCLLLALKSSFVLLYCLTFAAKSVQLPHKEICIMLGSRAYNVTLHERLCSTLFLSCSHNYPNEVHWGHRVTVAAGKIVKLVLEDFEVSVEQLSICFHKLQDAHQCCQLAFFNAWFHKFGIFNNDKGIENIEIYLLFGIFSQRFLFTVWH